MEMPLAEVIDRYLIVKLKKERLMPEQRKLEPFLEKEFLAYGQALDEFRARGINIKEEWLNGLYEIHKKCWDMEAAIRQGKEGTLGLEEVGRRTLILRDFNKERNALKNRITMETGLGFPEIKIQHGGQDQEFLDELAKS